MSAHLLSSPSLICVHGVCCSQFRVSYYLGKILSDVKDIVSTIPDQFQHVIVSKDIQCSHIKCIFALLLITKHSQLVVSIHLVTKYSKYLNVYDLVMFITVCLGIQVIISSGNISSSYVKSEMQKPWPAGYIWPRRLDMAPQVIFIGPATDPVKQLPLKNLYSNIFGTILKILI